VKASSFLRQRGGGHARRNAGRLTRNGQSA
jgi:hypothetical protein